MKQKFLEIIAFLLFGVVVTVVCVLSVVWYMVETPVVYWTYPDKEITKVSYIDEGEEVILQGEAAKEWLARWDGGYTSWWVAPSDDR